MAGEDKKPRKKNIVGVKHYRIISSRYPPISLFENLVDPDELEILFEIENMTNNHLREQAGDISLVANQDRIAGAGSSPVMAAFTYIGYSSRFTDGQQYGVYYAGLSHETTIKESRFHQERNLSYTKEPACELQMRCYVGTVQSALHDIRGESFDLYKSPDLSVYPSCQKLAVELRDQGSNGLYYKSARDEKGECIALFKPIATSPVQQSKHYAYKWDGVHINHVLEIKTVFEQ